MSVPVAPHFHAESLPIARMQAAFAMRARAELDYDSQYGHSMYNVFTAGQVLTRFGSSSLSVLTQHSSKTEQ